MSGGPNKEWEGRRDRKKGKLMYALFRGDDKVSPRPIDGRIAMFMIGTKDTSCFLIILCLILWFDLFRLYVVRMPSDV